MKHCVNCLKYCIYACALECCAPIDGIYNCIFYTKAICSDGVTGFGDIMKNVDFMGKKIRDALEFADIPQPMAKFGEYRP
jgi:hypothetical protein